MSPRLVLVDDAVSSDESRTFRTRLIVSREDLPRVLGRGGQTINSIRDQTGGSVQAIDLPNSSEEKMILLEGQLRQVVESFDLVTQVGTFVVNAHVYLNI